MRNDLKSYPVAWTLLILTGLVFLAMQVLRFGQSETALTIYHFGGFFGYYMKANPLEAWRLLSAIFVHIGWEHFAFNMITLYYIGRICEQLFGSWRFLALYLLSGIMGNLAVLVFTPNVVVAGASTSLFGLFAAIVVAGYFGRNPYVKQLGQSYFALIIFNLFYNILTPGISLAGHLGGLLGGALLSVAIPNTVESYIFKKDERRAAWVAYILLVLVALFFGMLG